MRHKVKGRKFGREKHIREPFLLNIAQGLIEHGRIKTTLARAKEVRPIVEKFITKSKSDSVQTRRYLRKFFAPKIVSQFIEKAKSFKNRNGGYTRILKLNYRHTDSAKMAILELLNNTDKTQNDTTKQ